MSLLYIDACCIIYLIEAANPFHASVAHHLTKHSGKPNATLITSRLARLECRTKPLRDNDTTLLARYEAFFMARRFRVVEVSPAVVETATSLRAKYGLKTPDALHLATAILEKADAFLTGDHGLQRCTDIHVDVIT